MRAPLLLVLLGACAVDDPIAPARAPRDPHAPSMGLPSELEAVEPFALGQLGLGEVFATGVARHAATGNLWLTVVGVGLVETTPVGQTVRVLPHGQELPDLGFTDLALLEDGSFALTAPYEAYRYRPESGSLSSYFCFIPEEAPIVQENQALAYDRASGLLYVAPTDYDTSSGMPIFLNAEIEVYAAADGSWVSAANVSATGIVARGFAFDPDGETLWAVEGTRLHRFSRAGALFGTTPLEGVAAAEGVFVDGDRLVVLDRSPPAVHVFSRPPG